MPKSRKSKRSRYSGSKVRSKKLTKGQKKQVKQIIHRDLEVKIYEIKNTAIPVTAGGSLAGPFVLASQNTGDSQRIADEIMYSNIELEYTAYATSTAPGNMLRVIIFQWFMNTATTTPTLGAILQDPSAAYSVTSPLNNTNLHGKLFRVISDRRFAMGNVSRNAISRTVNIKNSRIPRKRLQYNPTATTGFNHIYAYFISDGAINIPSLTYYVRTYYTDP